MSRVVNLEGTRFVIGECQCPGRPHPEDEAMLRAEGGVGIISAVEGSALLPNGVWSNWEARIRLVALFLVSWNLLGPDGQPAPATEQSIRLLDEDTLTLLSDECDDRLRRAKPLPNASGAPSVTSSPGSASSIPAAEPTPSSSG